MVVLGGSGGLTVEASRYPVASRGFGLGTGAYSGPATWADVEPDSFRLS